MTASDRAVDSQGGLIFVQLALRFYGLRYTSRSCISNFKRPSRIGGQAAFQSNRKVSNEASVFCYGGKRGLSIQRLGLPSARSWYAIKYLGIHRYVDGAANPEGQPATSLVHLGEVG